MKKTLLALALACASASTFAASPLIQKYDSALVEVSYTDSEILDAVELDGFRFNYERELDRTIGLHFQHDYMNVDDLDLNLTQLGITYDLPLQTNILTVSPEVGISHLDVNTTDESETALYFGLNVEAELVHNSLYGKAYVRKFDEDIFESEVLGVKLSYAMDNDVSVHVGFEDMDEMETVYAGFGVTF